MPPMHDGEKPVEDYARHGLVRHARSAAIKRKEHRRLLGFWTAAVTL